MVRTRAALLAVVVLAGCAAPAAYREGQDLASQGRVPEALAKFAEANRLDPGVAEYRLALLATRERYMAAQIERAEDLRRQERLAEAEQVFRQVLTVQSTNERALAGLRAIEQQRRLDGWVGEAEAAAGRKDADTARARLRAVLLEDPAHERARALLRKLEEDSARPAPETMLAAAYRKPITIEFKDVALRTVFEVISRTSGLNFLFDKDVKTDQKTSIFLKNSTIENAVNLALLTNQLDQRVLDANTILIYPNTQAKQKDYQPLTVRSFYLANADAKTVAATLKTILKTRDVVVDDKLNMLIVRDSPEAIRMAEKLVAMHDLPEPEVMLEVEILEVKRTRLLDLGVRWPDSLALSPIPTGTGGVLTLSDLRSLNSSTTAAAIGPLTINAKKTDTDANILANPRIRTRNHEKAKILIGQRVPNITATSTSTGFVAETVNYVDVGLKLEVEPTIYLDGEVAIKVALEVSNIIRQVQTKSGTTAYEIGTRTAQTVLRLSASCWYVMVSPAKVVLARRLPSASYWLRSVVPSWMVRLVMRPLPSTDQVVVRPRASTCLTLVPPLTIAATGYSTPVLHVFAGALFPPDESRRNVPPPYTRRRICYAQIARSKSGRTFAARRMDEERLSATANSKSELAPGIVEGSGRVSPQAAAAPSRTCSCSNPDWNFRVGHTRPSMTLNCSR